MGVPLAGLFSPAFFFKPLKIGSKKKSSASIPNAICGKHEILFLFNHVVFKLNFSIYALNNYSFFMPTL